MSRPFLKFLETEGRHLDQAGLLRREPSLESAQGPVVTVNGKALHNLCSTDYLGLAADPEVKTAAKAAIDRFGSGLASPRMVSGTLGLHQELEQAVSAFLGTQDTLVYASGYHAHTGLFESLVSDRDCIFADAQLQPALADGIRLSRAKVFSYRSKDAADLEDRLRRSRAARFRIIVTDGVYPLDGATAPLPDICALAEKYDAMVVLGDGQGIGTLGATGRGTSEALGVTDKMDVITGTFGHALGGGGGGFVSGRAPVIQWLRQKSRPYLVSTALEPAAAAAALKSLELLRAHPEMLEDLRTRIGYLRAQAVERGFQPVGTLEHPAVPIHVGDAVTTQRVVDLLYRAGFLVLGFCHPVVPEGAARIRPQLTLRHTHEAIRGLILALAQALKSVSSEQRRG